MFERFVLGAEDATSIYRYDGLALQLVKLGGCIDEVGGEGGYAAFPWGERTNVSNLFSGS